MLDYKLKNKVVIITGGASGIGRSCVELFAKEGSQVIFIDKNKDLGEKLVSQFVNTGLVEFIYKDLTEEGCCQKVVSQVLEKFNRIDVLINNAGVNDHVGLDMSVESFKDSLSKNLVHYFEMVKYCRESLIASKGKIINISSKVARTGQGGTSGYAAAKGGVLSLTREWALEFSEEEVCVNSIIPAEVITEMYQKELDLSNDPESSKRKVEASIPLGRRMTTANEVANAVLFLSSVLANHMTGQFIYVDGGYTHLDRVATL